VIFARADARRSPHQETVNLSLLRQIHLYLALFLTPWILMYATSTFVMNHRVHFQKSGGPLPEMTQERTVAYDGTFPARSTPAQMAGQILTSLGLDGTFRTSHRTGDNALVIDRLDPVTPRRITWHPQSRSVTIERLPWNSRAFLERMHRRRGYQYDWPIAEAWAASVDLFCAAVLAWTLTGLWMWWEIRATRRWGALALAVGAVIFTVFLLTL
jgi:hypothetical protein